MKGGCDDPKVIDLAMTNVGGSFMGSFALARQVNYEVLVAKLEELFGKFKLEIFKPTETMKTGRIKV